MSRVAKIYFRIARFFHLKAIKHLKPSDSKPVGIPYQRDPQAPCEFYEPIKKGGAWSFTDCETDGHYLCDKCIHKQRSKSGKESEV